MRKGVFSVCTVFNLLLAFFSIEFLLGLALMSRSALTCETSTATFTRNSTNLTSVVISADVDLTVHLVEADSFELSTSFYGRDSATSVCSESYAEDSTTWIIHVGASAPPPLR